MNPSEFKGLPMPAQSPYEWYAFLEYARSYFMNRGITNPLVVEIGILHGKQKQFYKDLLGADYIGIDIDPKAEPDILGDTADETTLEALKAKLDGREIDLLFIDGCHTREYQWNDYNRYAPLTRHIVAVHDIFHINGAEDFWQELVELHRYDPKLIFLTIGCATEYPSLKTPPVAPRIAELSESLGVDFEQIGHVFSQSDGFYGIGLVVWNEWYGDKL